MLSCIVLFDIDGTLLTGPVDGPSPGVRAMLDAAREHTTTQTSFRDVPFAGRTDRQIARDLLDLAGWPSNDRTVQDAILHGYLQRLQVSVETMPYRPLPCVRETVLALRNAGAVVGLGTGNLRQGAALKLRSAALLDLFDLDLGGYADDGDDRPSVIAAGAKRCGLSRGMPVIVVGDTPLDVMAAHAIGAKCVAVSTGTFGPEALTACGADAVIRSFETPLLEVLQPLLEHE